MCSWCMCKDDTQHDKKKLHSDAEKDDEDVWFFVVPGVIAAERDLQTHAAVLEVATEASAQLAKVFLRFFPAPAKQRANAERRRRRVRRQSEHVVPMATRHPKSP